MQIPPDGEPGYVGLIRDAGGEQAQVTLLREAEDMPWGERIATVADPEGNPVALCQTRSAPGLGI